MSNPRRRRCKDFGLVAANEDEEEKKKRNDVDDEYLITINQDDNADRKDMLQNGIEEINRDLA